MKIIKRDGTVVDYDPEYNKIYRKFKEKKNFS